MFAPLSGTLLWTGAEKNGLEPVLAWGNLSAASVGLQDCWALRRGRPHRGGAEGLRCTHVAAADSHLCVPLVAHNETLGVLCLQTPSTEALSSDSESLALTFGEHLAVTLANLRLRESLQQQSIRDPLTGLFNRRYLEETLERELHRSVRAGRPLSFIMLDIDHFKTFNDTFGHEAGDAVLIQIAALAKTLVRTEDIACRYGGEEFALILPDASEPVAVERAEKLRQAAAELHLSFRGQSLGTATLSLGVATATSYSDLSELVSSSDKALYAAKRGGRNQVVAAPSRDATYSNLLA